MKRQSHNKTVSKLLSPGLLLLLTSSLLLGACSSGRYGDLESYIEEVKSQQKGRIESLPEVKPYDTFAYNKEDLRNPFTAYTQEVINPVNPGSGPNMNRKREPLEQYPLDSLQFVGHLEKSGARWGLISAPDSSVYRIQVGNYLGKNYGKIVSITETNIKLVEIIPSGTGGWIDREASLSLSE